MSVFRSLFGRRQEPPADPIAIQGSLEELLGFCRDVIRLVGEQVFAEESMERKVLSVYAFGGADVLRQQRRYTAAETHALMLALLRIFFGYTPEDSAVKAQAVIEGAGDRTSRFSGIIHRGIDGFLDWQQQKEAFDASDVNQVILELKGM